MPTADNRLAEIAKWDRATLRAEFTNLIELEFDLEITGFSTGQIDLILDEGKQADPDESELSLESGPATTRPGDLWLL